MAHSYAARLRDRLLEKRTNGQKNRRTDRRSAALSRVAKGNTHQEARESADANQLQFGVAEQFVVKTRDRPMQMSVCLYII